VDFTKDWSKGSAQALRSCGQWSNECSREASIQAAYLRAIKNSKHCIYIENQFFVSGTASELIDENTNEETTKTSNEVTNGIGQALVERVARAIEECQRNGKTNFKIVIINPLWPGMAGAVKDSTGIQCILQWQQKTINKGKNSIFGQLKRLFPDEADIPITLPLGSAHWAPEKKLQAKLEHFIKFFTLRQHDKRPFIQGDPVCDGYAVTEQIYVHSKLMIVDDQTVIIGSANINDRSLHGERDSEVCVISGPAHEVHEGELCKSEDDKSMKKIQMFGEKGWEATHFAHTLRVHLWAEHMGNLKDGDHVDEAVALGLEDPGIAYEKFLTYAEGNTEIYDKVFPDSPNNEHHTLKQLIDCIDKRSVDTYPKPKEQGVGHQMLLFAQDRLLRHIKGHICTTSIDFLSEEDLTPPATDMYGLMPAVCFV
jgi:phospholipase D1/2